MAVAIDGDKGWETLPGVPGGEAMGGWAAGRGSLAQAHNKRHAISKARRVLDKVCSAVFNTVSL